MKRDRRKLGVRPYKNYNSETLRIATEQVASKKMSSREAEKQFGVPRKSILNRIKGLHSKSVGVPKKLTD